MNRRSLPLLLVLLLPLASAHAQKTAVPVANAIARFDQHAQRFLAFANGDARTVLAEARKGSGKRCGFIHEVSAYALPSGALQLVHTSRFRAGEGSAQTSTLTLSASGKQLSLAGDMVSGRGRVLRVIDRELAFADGSRVMSRTIPSAVPGTMKVERVVLDRDGKTVASSAR
jgi:hypothetical protein